MDGWMDSGRVERTKHVDEFSVRKLKEMFLVCLMVDLLVGSLVDSSENQSIKPSIDRFID